MVVLGGNAPPLPLKSPLTFDPRLCTIYKDASDLVRINPPRNALVRLLIDKGGESTNQVKVVSTVETLVG